MGALKTWTKIISGTSITISADQRVQKISLKTLSGTTQVTGDLIFNGMASENIPLGVGEGITLSTDNFANTLDGITINAGGSCEIILQVS